MKKTPDEKIKKNSIYGISGLANQLTPSTGIAEPIYYNDAVHIVYEACKSCYGIKGDDKSYEEIKDYIGRRVIAGHDSITEHSNIIIGVYNVSKEYGADLMRLLTGPRHLCKYLKVISNLVDKDGETAETFDTIFQGSIRAFKHLIVNFNWNEEENIFIGHIRRQLYQCTVKEFWLNVDPEIMDPSQFIDNLFVGQLDIDDPTDASQLQDENIDEPFTISYKSDKFEIVNIDNAATIQYLTKPLNIMIDDEELREMSTITVLFKDMSRTATHQLVRHRNAITQESQRYVNYDEAGFTVPPIAKYLPDEDTFEIDLYGIKKKCSLESLGKELCKIYGQLRKQGIRKEDARGYLPSNVQCRKIYMTFTFASLFKFFELRCETHAQAEIREFAWELFRTLLKLQDCKTKGYTEEFAEEYDIDITSPFYIPGLKDHYELLKKYDDTLKNEGTTEEITE